MAACNLVRLGTLDASRTAFFLCDIQEIFRPHVKQFGEVVRVANKMVEAAKVFKIPVFVSEQYRKGLGPTTSEICLESAAFVYEKTKFSMYTPELKEALKKELPVLESVILLGLETQICVEQTAIDLVSENIKVHVLADGVTSRSYTDRSLALQRLQALGCFVTTAENVLFKLMKDKNHPGFKQISKLCKEPTSDAFTTETTKAKL